MHFNKHTGMQVSLKDNGYCYLNYSSGDWISVERFGQFLIEFFYWDMRELFDLLDNGTYQDVPLNLADLNIEALLVQNDFHLWAYNQIRQIANPLIYMIIHAEFSSFLLALMGSNSTGSSFTSSHYAMRDLGLGSISTETFIEYGIHPREGSPPYSIKTYGDFCKHFLLELLREKAFVKHLVQSLEKKDMDALVDLYSDSSYVQGMGYHISADKDTRMLMASYSIQDALSLSSFEVYHLFQSGGVVKKCPNCNQYFIPENRSDTIFCTRIAPQDENKTCQEYGKYLNYLKKTQDDESLKLYRQIYNRKNNKRRRCITAETPEGNPALNQDLASFVEASKAMKRKIQVGTITEIDYIRWLKCIKEGVNHGQYNALDE